ncbi:BON domain-containing protein [Caballeronia sp. SEWSISQ10-4 2]|uniref:BON domain-containing protein n=1 Tax=Caballeronia sp. SEWSISQ10-4 2 TaxID=2937438 RepID=UPI0026533F5F|nr:BON domain-containing protein [Caballeronia sp. SEWSISQ10-4 2]MDN7177278.1 BON domain-containing protein [Caballeronia sp. SEWSISQ10-4 2]
MKLIKSIIIAAALATTLGTTYAQDVSKASTSSSKKAARAQNRQLENSVRKALDKEKLDASDIRLKVKNGDVALEGTVQRAEEIQVAGNVAKSVKGVENVQNDLTLRTEGH